MIRIKTLYILLLLSVLSGCKKDEYETVNRSYGKGYINSSIGSYNIYAVEEIVYNDFFNTVDTLRYQLKEVNESIFTDNLNRPSVRVERYKLNSKGKWEILNVWYSTEDNYVAERVEDNKRVIKLSFPLAEDAVWDINLYNSDNSMNVFYDLINQKYTMDTFSFDSAVAVKSETVNTTLRQRQYYEVYAKNTGLVFKNNVSIDKNGTLLRGYKIKQQLIKHVP